jgi:hypothetical protein
MKAVRVPAPDLFAPIAGAGDDAVLAGLESLRTAALWPPPLRWPDVIAAAKAFSIRWGGPCQACGWTTLDLWGVDRKAPAVRWDAMGGVWLAVRSAHHVLEVDRDAILVVSRAGSRLRIYKPAPPVDSGAVLAWELCLAGAPDPAPMGQLQQGS